jgi:uncharacterized peroxidase-related enzyme
MSRIKPLNFSKLIPDIQNILFALETDMGFMPNDALVMAHKPDVMSAFGALVQAVYDDQSEISSVLKRLIGLVTSQAAGCRYCQAHTAHAALNHDIDDAKLKALWEYETSPHYSDAERAALRLAQAAGMSPAYVSEDIFTELNSHFSNSQIVEIVTTISLFGFLNKWNSVFETEIETLPKAVLNKYFPH